MTELMFEQPVIDMEHADEYEDKVIEVIQHNLEVAWKELQDGNFTQEEYRELGERMGKVGMAMNNIDESSENVMDTLQRYARLEGELIYAESLQHGETANRAVEVFITDFRILTLDYIELIKKEIATYVEEEGGYPHDVTLEEVIEANSE